MRHYSESEDAWCVVMRHYSESEDAWCVV